MKWYMTVGYPGGELAVQASDIADAERIMDQKIGGLQRVRAYISIFTRNCPPDLVEWIEVVMHCWDTSRSCSGYLARLKVPGGWLYEYEIDPNKVPATRQFTFAPVAGAAGLTVLGEGG